MAWKRDRARSRIAGFMDNVPEGHIVVEDFKTYLNEARLTKRFAFAQDGVAEESLLRIPRNKAITTHGVHVYANLIDFNDVLVDAGRETQASHRRALTFLHTHYSACDSLIREFELQRVDFHGSRLHAVVLTPEGPVFEGERVRKALAFAAAFREMVERLSRDDPEFQTGVRIGIDTGPAVAIDGGKKDEPEPLFIGSPANYAAKLAAGDREGILVSQRARLVSARSVGVEHAGEPLAKAVERRFLDEQVVASGVRLAADSRLETAYARFKDERETRRFTQGMSAPVFVFHHKEPPLRSLVFAEHPPSNAIRMPMASLFADIDGFTVYIDNAIRSGRIAEAVANLHVLRAEMAAVLRDDFNGRKVRFIGDCIHGLVAEGTAHDTNSTDTIRQAVMAAAGIRSSFELCQTMLPGIHTLGLAIGIEYGETPVCRLGLRGVASVRSAASRATCVSEDEQKDCDGTQTALGPDAFQAAPYAIRSAFIGRKVSNLTYDVAEVLTGTMPSPYVRRNDVEPQAARAVAAQPLRAHTRL